MLDQEAIARLTYFYWEGHGCPNDSPGEDWSGQKQNFATGSLPPHLAEAYSRRMEPR
jgi:GTP-dependent phosphoenolpyruvate carboxykinase